MFLIFIFEQLFFWDFKIISQVYTMVVLTYHTKHPMVYGIPYSQHICKHLLPFLSFLIIIITGVRWYGFVALICISLVTTEDIGHFYRWLFATCVCSFVLTAKRLAYGKGEKPEERNHSLGRCTRTEILIQKVVWESDAQTDKEYKQIYILVNLDEHLVLKYSHLPSWQQVTSLCT